MDARPADADARSFGAATAVRAEPIVPLAADPIARLVSASPAPSGWTVRVVRSTGSTNSDLLACARAARWAGPVVLAAEIQLAGRGRLGRTWASSIGRSLTASFALRVRRRLATLDGVTLVCGLAVQDVLSGCDVPARLKWPNDLVVDDRKLAGILVEACPDGESTTLVVGVGLNVLDEADAEADADADATAAVPGASAWPPLARTSLQRCASRVLDRNRLCAGIALALERELAAFETSGFAASAARWNRVDAFRDRRVALTTAAETTVGIARGVDERGALLVDVGGERRRIVAGDVSLRPAAPRGLAIG